MRLLLKELILYKRVYSFKKMNESILQEILNNTAETKNQLIKLQDGLSKIEIVTEQNKVSIDHLDRIVWKSIGENPTLLQTYTEHHSQLQQLTYTVNKLENDLKIDIDNLAKKIDDKNQLFQMIILSLLMAIVGGGITYVVDQAKGGGR